MGDHRIRLTKRNIIIMKCIIVYFPFEGMRVLPPYSSDCDAHFEVHIDFRSLSHLLRGLRSIWVDVGGTITFASQLR